MLIGGWRLTVAILCLLCPFAGTDDDTEWFTLGHQNRIKRQISKQSTTKPSTQPIGLPKELASIKWGQYISGPEGELKLPKGKTAIGFDTDKRTYFLGFGNPNFVFGNCSTPTRQAGRCRFLEHCARPETMASLDQFLASACLIGKDYMGVCCPEGKSTTVTTRGTTKKPAVTQRTTTKSVISRATTKRPVSGSTSNVNGRATSKPSNRQNTTAASQTSLPKELRAIKWGQYVRGTQGELKLPTGKKATGFAANGTYFLGYGRPDFPFGDCTTPTRTKGKCRFLQYCAEAEFLASLDRFLAHACLIGKSYMGVCCVEVAKAAAPRPTGSRPATTKRPTATRTTTKKPTTKNPTTTRPKRCGERDGRITTRIVGGKPADKGEWPWMAALLRDGDDQFCGGVLISDQHILTASHCVDAKKPSELTVRLGEYDFEKKSAQERDFQVSNIFMHEGYERKTHTNDIALLRLRAKVPFNAFIWPICLPPSNIILENQLASVTGWGTTSFNGASSDVLLELILPVWKQAECKAAFKQPITDKQLCAGYKAGGKDSCQGDSGGPLMYEVTPDRWTTVGIVSWGIRCAQPGKPGVYTRVASYLDWIKDKMTKIQSNPVDRSVSRPMAQPQRQQPLNSPFIFG